MSLIVADVVGWVLKHRKNKVFEGFTTLDIANSVAQAVKLGSFAFAVDDGGQLSGVCVATPDKWSKKLRVHHILATDKRVLPAMVRTFRDRFPGWTITAQRRGKEVVFNTGRLVELLEDK